jgi:hypothetical protein
VVLAPVLTGCATSHNAILLSKTGNTAGTATFTPDGKIEIRLKGRVYMGQWAYAPTGGVQIAGGFTGLGFGGFGVRPDDGEGTVLAASDDGDSMRCVYRYNKRTTAGIGECRDGGGEVFDFQIR